VDEAARLPLTHWESFYVIVGGAAAALTGLQFVVVALINETPIHATEDTIDAFSTPTIVHFAMALLTSAVVSAPWVMLSHAAIAIGACGLGGLGYSLLVVRRARKVTTYRPVLEDWIWHVILPPTAYATLGSAAVFLPRHATSALFFVAGAVLLLLFIGIHNAWDAVTYLTLESEKQ